MTKKRDRNRHLNGRTKDRETKKGRENERKKRKKEGTKEGKNERMKEWMKSEKIHRLQSKMAKCKFIFLCRNKCHPSNLAENGVYLKKFNYFMASF